MRLIIRSRNRLGITQEMLAVFARLKIDVRAVDMFTHHTYVDAPSVTARRLEKIKPELLAIPGVKAVAETSVLPSEERREQLASILSTLHEPVVAIDKFGAIVLANSAAATAFDVDDSECLKGKPLSDLVPGDIASTIMRFNFELAEREISIDRQRYILRCSPLRLRDKGESELLGGVIILTHIEQVARLITTLNDRGVTGFDDILGESPVMRRLRERAQRLAAIDAPLLITGDTGVGKGLVARACHAVSARKGAPFLAFDCAAQTEMEAETELFGRAEGAYGSTASTGKPGLLELAHNGALYLDNVTNLSPYLQARLLQYLEAGSVRRVGAETGRAVNVRIITSTQVDPAALSGDGRFREDLLYRLNVLNLSIPPLSQRTADIPQLAYAFVQRAAARLGKAVPEITQEALWKLRHRSWPGNVRQLENVVFQTVIEIPDDERIRGFVDLERNEAPTPSADNDEQWPDLNGALEAFEKRLLGQLYKKYRSSRKLADRLKTSHSTIARKLRHYSISS